MTETAATPTSGAMPVVPAGGIDVRVPLGIEGGVAKWQAMREAAKNSASPVALATDAGKPVAAAPPSRGSEAGSEPGYAGNKPELVPHNPGSDQPSEPAGADEDGAGEAGDTDEPQPEGPDAAEDADDDADTEIDFGDGKGARKLAEVKAELEAVAAKDAEVAKAAKRVDEAKQALQQGYQRLEQEWRQSQEALAAAQQQARQYQEFLGRADRALAEQDKFWDTWNFARRKEEVGYDQAERELELRDVHMRAKQASESERAQLAQEREHAEAVALQRARQQCVTNLPRVHPDWADPEKLQADLPRLNQAGMALGFTDDELSYTTDPRIYGLLRKAAEFDRLTAQGKAVMEGARKGAPSIDAQGGQKPPAATGKIKVVRPGASSPRSSNPKAVQSGRLGAATKAFNQAPTTANAVQLWQQQQALRAMNARRG